MWPSVLATAISGMSSGSTPCLKRASNSVSASSAALFGGERVFLWCRRGRLFVLGPRFEFRQRVFGSLLGVEAFHDFLRQQYLDVARVAPLLHFFAPASDFPHAAERQQFQIAPHQRIGK